MRAASQPAKRLTFDTYTATLTCGCDIIHSGPKHNVDETLGPTTGEDDCVPCDDPGANACASAAEPAFHIGLSGQTVLSRSTHRVAAAGCGADPAGPISVERSRPRPPLALPADAHCTGIAERTPGR